MAPRDQLRLSDSAVLLLPMQVAVLPKAFAEFPAGGAGFLCRGRCPEARSWKGSLRGTIRSTAAPVLRAAMPDRGRNASRIVGSQQGHRCGFGHRIDQKRIRRRALVAPAGSCFAAGDAVPLPGAHLDISPDCLQALSAARTS